MQKKPLSFVIQKHHAKNLHDDFRLEYRGKLKSWAVPKRVSKSLGVKRLAIQVEDHALSYGSFEGIIPKGQYGAGKVEIWDEGTYIHQSHDENGASISFSKALKRGHIEIELSGKKIKGVYILHQMEGKNWLLFKKKT